MAKVIFQLNRTTLLRCNYYQVRHGHRMRGKPPTIASTLKQRLELLNKTDPEIDFEVNIGFSVEKLRKTDTMKKWAAEIKLRRSNPDLEKLSRKGEVSIDYDRVEEDWQKTVGLSQILKIAKHYGIYKDLYGDAYFLPVVPLKIDYSLELEDTVARVYRGNVIKPNEAQNPPSVDYDCDADSLWTLIMTTPDGNLKNSYNEYCHWFIGNIPGNRIDKGEQLIDYLRPIPPRGLGYCRYIFVLYKQEQRIDYSEYKKEKPCLDLLQRDWNTYNFYKKYQASLTPAGLVFFQSDWDETLTDFYHAVLQMKEPLFEYDFPKPYVKPQVWFPLKKAFNLYLDRYRNPKEIQKEFLLKKLKKVHPFKEPEPPLKFPNAVDYEPKTPAWLKIEIEKERLGWGRVNDID